MMVNLRLAIGLAVAAFGLSGCNLHREGAVRSALDGWFFLGDTLYFESKRLCTVAVYRAADRKVKSGLPVGKNSLAAQHAFRQSGLAGARSETKSPQNLIDEMLATEDGALGTPALSAAALAGPCLDDEASGGLHAALLRPGALIAYSTELSGIMVLDHDTRKLFFAAGEPF